MPGRFRKDLIQVDRLRPPATVDSDRWPSHPKGWTEPGLQAPPVFYHKDTDGNIKGRCLKTYSLKKSMENQKAMEKLEQIYEGKAKKVFATSDPDVVIVDYKDDATAFNGEKKGTITGKGVVNNRMTNHVFKILEEKGVPTHYIEELSDRETAVKRVEIVPLEVIIRNVAAGSFSKRLGVEEGRQFSQPTIEFSYKNDELGDPLINSYFALALDLATKEEIDTIKEYAFKVNDVLKEYFLQADIKLIDFKIEFGRFHGQIILADEISPDTCRLWDVHTNEKLDKDRFRRDLGNVEEAYNEVFERLGL